MKIIIDTDIGMDCDDAGALAVAHALADMNKCEIIAITSCTSRVSGIAAIDVINRYYGRPEIPIGAYLPDGFLDENPKEYYSEFICRNFHHSYPDKKNCADAIKVLRKALSEVRENELTIVSIGQLNNMAALLKSKPDDLFSLSGLEIIKQKNIKLVSMAGCFIDTDKYFAPNEPEWNVKMDVASAKFVVENWPAGLIFCPFEMGAVIKTGQMLSDTPKNNPVRECYKQFAIIHSSHIRESWDQTAVHYAVTQDEELWSLSENGRILMDNFGVTSFVTSEPQNRFFVSLKNAEAAFEQIEQLMAKLPKNQP